ncbi:MAG: aldehyde dehydrogenase family protein [Candidatus Hadarchaeum sp.]|uniref:aldehyde dehydrogenase family protein n=1 Tax=Candidatus Hadarchaeum sp. TaxID=2883567 RepID=UPI003D0C9D4B
MKTIQMLIDGEWRSAKSTYNVINPANTEEVVAKAPLGTRSDAQEAIEAAYRAFSAWSQKSPYERAKLLRKAAAIVMERIEELGRLLTLETGKPLKDSLKEIEFAVRVLQYYAEEATRVFGEWVPTISQSVRSIVIRQPVGVAGLIVPWNFPVDLLAWKLGPALAAGCTVVIKPSSEAPAAATEFVRAVNDAGFPRGVINVVPGKASEVGLELVENPKVAKLSFTGETETGKYILERAAKHLKRVSLELGGNAAAIVCDDAPLEVAISGCVRRAFSHMGQICISINRVYILKEIAKSFIEGVVEATTKLKVGNGLNPETDLGPMFREELRQKTKEHIRDALEKGARLLCGGKEPEGEEYEKGFFFIPTVLIDVDHRMRIMREETFGPVMPIMVVQSLDEAIKLANDTRYGLAAYVFTKDLSKAIILAERLEAGGVAVNINDVTELQAPFGGWKQSGIGRELSRHALDSYLEYKHIRIGII